MSTLLWIVAILLTLLIVLFAWDRDGFWTRLFGNPDLGDVKFATLARGKKPNEALACPPSFCPDYRGQIETTSYALPPALLLERLDDALHGEERVQRVDDGSDPLKRRYVTRSSLMRFPDTVSVEAFEADNGQSQIAMFARAQLGYSDMGANKARIEDWLKAMNPYEAVAED